MGFDYVNAFHGLKATELGSVKDLPRAVLPNSGNPTVLEVKAIEASFADQMARAIAITVVNNSIKNPAGLNVNTGPIVGIVEWGTGGAYSRIEFNIPPAYTWQQNGDIGNPVQGQNGVTLTVFGSSIRVMARNEARLPPANDPAAVQGPDFDGNYSAFISQGTGQKPCGPLQRAIIAVSANGNNLPAIAAVNIGIPRFAKRVRFPREPLSVPLTVTVGGDIAGSAYAEGISGGSQGQIELSPLANTLGIANAGAVPITALTAVFDLEL